MNRIILGIIIFFSLIHFGYTAIDSTQTKAIDVQYLKKELSILRDENKAITQHAENLQRKFTLSVNASAYTPSVNECDKDIKNTALMIKPRPGWHVAVSHDLLWLLGKKVYIKDVGVRFVSDLMNERHKNKIDIMVGSKKEAKKFGLQFVELVVLND